MYYKIIISLLGLLSYASLRAQIADKNFMRYTQICHVNGTTEEYVVVQVFGDSTITLSTYVSSYRDQYMSVTRNQFFGRAVVSGDTISSVVDSTLLETRYRIAAKTRSKKGFRNKVTLSSKLRLVLTKSGLFWLDYPGSELTTIDVTMVFEKASEFASLFGEPIASHKRAIMSGASTQQGFGKSRGVLALPVK